MLKLLLDEEISPGVADGLRRRSGTLPVFAMAEWEGGNFVGKDASDILREAADQELTLVTYERLTIPTILKAWSEEECLHGGVIFVDEKAISPAETGELVTALARVQDEAGSWEWTNRVTLLR
jgi:hypothetical protein